MTGRINIILLVFAVCFVSCTRDESVFPAHPGGQLEEQTLVSVLSGKSYTPEEFTEALGSPSMNGLLEYIMPESLTFAKVLWTAKLLTRLPALDRQFAQEAGKGAFDRRCWELQSYTFSYRSWTVDGREVVMSGRVTFPNNKTEGISHQVKTLSLHSHQALLNPDCAPSENLMYMPLRALWDSAVIEPDFQQFGINYKKEYGGFGSPVTLARQLTDCIIAALEVMRMHGVTLSPDGYTTNWGSSQGGWVPLCFARYYETEAPEWFRSAIRLRSTFTGEGACEFPGFILDYVCAHPELLPVEINMLIAYFYAFTPEQLGGYTPEDFVAPWLNEKKIELGGGRKINLLEAISMGIRDYDEQFDNLSSLQQVLAPDLLHPDGSLNTSSPKYRAWANWLNANQNYSGWNPSHPIYMASCRDDVVIPFAYVEKNYNTLSDYGNNPNVMLAEVGSIGNQPIGGFDPHFIIAFLMQINMACVEEPEDMMKVYKPIQ